MNAITKTESQAISPMQGGGQTFDLTPRSFDEAIRLCDYLANSTMVPKDFRGNAGNCLIAVQWGMEVGLKPLQAMQNIAVINGRPSLWGDAVLAIVRAHPHFEYINETDDGHTATCRIKRKGEPEAIRTFSMDDAKLAGLTGKEGPWRQYPKRMRQMRARGFACRDVFPDALKGMPVAEEEMDTPRDMGAVDEVVTTAWTPELKKQATDAANKGQKAYGEFWKTLDRDTQAALAKTPEHDGFKQTARSFDESRTVDTPPTNKSNASSQAPATAPSVDPDTGEMKATADEVRNKLNNAKSEDALYVAMDWAEALSDEDRAAHITELEQLFNTRLAQIRGG